jgi:hypothetical protein
VEHSDKVAPHSSAWALAHIVFHFFLPETAAGNTQRVFRHFRTVWVGSGATQTVKNQENTNVFVFSWFFYSLSASAKVPCGFVGFFAFRSFCGKVGSCEIVKSHQKLFYM